MSNRRLLLSLGDSGPINDGQWHQLHDNVWFKNGGGSNETQLSFSLGDITGDIAFIRKEDIVINADYNNRKDYYLQEAFWELRRFGIDGYDASLRWSKENLDSPIKTTFIDGITGNTQNYSEKLAYDLRIKNINLVRQDFAFLFRITAAAEGSMKLPIIYVSQNEKDSIIGRYVPCYKFIGDVYGIKNSIKYTYAFLRNGSITLTQFGTKPDFNAYGVYDLDRFWLSQ